MMHTTKPQAIIALSIALAAMPCSGAFAKGVTPEQQALINTADAAPLIFPIPASQQSAVMDKAQEMITKWFDWDNDMSAMEIHVATDTFIRTYDPDQWGEVGFEISSENTGTHDEIKIAPISYQGPDQIFGPNKNAIDAKKALESAHLLAYELRHYSALLPADQHQPSATLAATSDAQPALPDDLELYMKLVRTQLAAGDYSTALTTVDSLKAAILNKQKQGTPQ